MTDSVLQLHQEAWEVADSISLSSVLPPPTRVGPTNTALAVQDAAGQSSNPLSALQAPKQTARVYGKKAAFIAAIFSAREWGLALAIERMGIAGTSADGRTTLIRALRTKARLLRVAGGATRLIASCRF